MKNKTTTDEYFNYLIMGLRKENKDAKRKRNRLMWIEIRNYSIVIMLGMLMAILIVNSLGL